MKIQAVQYIMIALASIFIYQKFFTKLHVLAAPESKETTVTGGEGAGETKTAGGESGGTTTNPPTGNTGSGNTGSGNTSSGNAGAGNAGAGNTSTTPDAANAKSTDEQKGFWQKCKDNWYWILLAVLVIAALIAGAIYFLTKGGE